MKEQFKNTPRDLRKYEENLIFYLELAVLFDVFCVKVKVHY